MDKTWEEGYKQGLDGLKFSDEKKARILENLIGEKGHASENVIKLNAKQQEKTKTKKKLHRLKPAAAAAVAAVIIGGGSFGVCAATGVIPVADSFKNVFQIDDGNAGKAEEIGNSIGTSVESNGIRMTADAIIGDKTHCAVVYTLEKTDGKPFNCEGETIKEDEKGTLALFFGDGSRDNVEIPYVDGYGYSGEDYFFASEDNKIKYIDKFYMDEKTLIGGRIESCFKDLYTFSEGDEIPEKSVAKGEWKFNIPLEYEDSGVLYSVNDVSTQNEDPVLTEYINISPIAYIVKYRGYEHLPVIICFKDGTEFDLNKNGYTSWENENSNFYMNTGMFDRLLSPDDVVSVKVGEKEYKLDELVKYSGTEDALLSESDALAEKTFKEGNKGLFYIDALYEGKERYDGFSIITYLKNTGEIVSEAFTGGEAPVVKKGEILSECVFRSSAIVKNDDLGNEISRYSLDEVGFRIEFKDEELNTVATVDLGDNLREFGKRYSLKITGDKNGGYQAEFLGEEELGIKE